LIKKKVEGQAYLDAFILKTAQISGKKREKTQHATSSINSLLRKGSCQAATLLRTKTKETARIMTIMLPIMINAKGVPKKESCFSAAKLSVTA